MQRRALFHEPEAEVSVMRMQNNWSRHFPAVPGLSDAVVRRLNQSAGELTARRSSDLLSFAAPTQCLFLLTTGSIRVHLRSRAGPNIRYYTASADIATTLTNACLVAQHFEHAKVVAETDIYAVTLPHDVFSDLMATSIDFRALVHCACSQRVTNLLRYATESSHSIGNEIGTTSVLRNL